MKDGIVPTALYDNLLFAAYFFENNNCYDN